MNLDIPPRPDPQSILHFILAWVPSGYLWKSFFFLAKGRISRFSITMLFTPLSVLFSISVSTSLSTWIIWQRATESYSLVTLNKILQWFDNGYCVSRFLRFDPVCRFQVAGVLYYYQCKIHNASHIQGYCTTMS